MWFGGKYSDSRLVPAGTKRLRKERRRQIEELGKELEEAVEPE